MSNILFLLTYAFEASIRKYLFSSYILIFVKYIFLFKIKFTKAIFNYSLILFCLSVPLIIHALSKETIPSIDLALYDLMTIFLSPILTLAIFTNNQIKNYRLARRFLIFVVLVGLLHSLLIIVQSISDPLSVINTSVYGDNSNIGFGGNRYKVTGLISTPSPFLNVSAILSIWYLRDSSKKKIFSNITYLIEIIIIASGIFNLSARFFFIVNLAPYFLKFIENFFQIATRLKINKKKIFFTVFTSLILIVFINKVTNFKTQNPFLSIGLERYQYKFMVQRVSSLYTDLLHINKVPDLIEAPGIGKTVGTRKEIWNLNKLESIERCKESGKEWDYSRMICLGGFYGYFLIIFCRLIPAFYLFKNYLSSYKKNIYKSSSYGILLVSFLFLLQAQFMYNDVLAGILILSLTTNTIFNFGQIDQKNLSPKN